MRENSAAICYNPFVMNFLASTPVKLPCDYTNLVNTAKLPCPNPASTSPLNQPVRHRWRRLEYLSQHFQMATAAAPSAPLSFFEVRFFFEFAPLSYGKFSMPRSYPFFKWKGLPHSQPFPSHPYPCLCLHLDQDHVGLTKIRGQGLSQSVSPIQR